MSTADLLSPFHQLAQFLSGIEHACFYSRWWHVQNVRYFVDRLLVVIDQVDDLTMLGRQSHQCSAHQFAPDPFPATRLPDHSPDRARLTPHIEKNVAQEVLGKRLIADEAE